MLKSLLVKNYVLIEHLEAEFGRGLTVFTGETGAGKSIIIDALGLIMGNRLSAGFQVHGDEKCVVEACFDISDHAMLQHLLANHDLSDNNELLVRREISKAGKSRAFVNDTPVTLQLLEEISLQLVDLHNQFANDAIRHAEFRLQVVDSVADTRKLSEQYRKQYEDFIRNKNYLFKQQQLLSQKIQESAFIEYQLQSIQETGVLSNEQFSELEEESHVLSNAGDLKTALFECRQLISDAEYNALFLLKSCDTLLAKNAEGFKTLAELQQRLSSSIVEIKDISTEIEKVDSRLVVDPDRLEIVNAKLDQLNNLFHKFRIHTFEELKQVELDFRNKMQDLENLKNEIESLQPAIAAEEKALQRLAVSLSEARELSFAKISELTQHMLQSLGMPHAKFKPVNQKSNELSPSGYDHIVYLFSANRNMPPADVSQTASGGELSRLMLCLKSLMSENDVVPTLIFDEIDTGVSGEIADKMGKIIQKLARNRQIISITHLPQIAAKGHSHYKVSKIEQHNKTITTLYLLSHDERIDELAAMLSGEVITDAARNHAKILLHQAESELKM